MEGLRKKRSLLFSDKNYNVSSETLNSVQIILVAFVYLIGASLLYPSIASPLIGVSLGLPLIIYISYIILKKYDSFSFMLIIFICNHFRFYENFWPLFFVVIFLLFNSHEVFISHKKEKNNKFIIFLFRLLFVFNLIGLILNENGSLTDRLLGFSVFSSYFLIFYLCLNKRLSNWDITRFIQVLIFLVFFQLFICLLQKLGLFDLDLPYLPLSVLDVSSDSSLAEYRISGSFGDFELLAEYAALLLVFFLSISLYYKIAFVFPLKILIPIIVALSCLILMTGTRSSLVLIVLALLFFLITHLKILFAPRFWFSILAIIVVFFLMIRQGDPLGLQLVFNRISEMQQSSNAKMSSDELINRDYTFKYAYKRLNEKPWIIGDGYTNGEGYKMSLFGSEFNTVEIRDYHSLYLSIPIFWGWVGGFVMVFIFALCLYIFLRDLFISRNNSLGQYVSLGFFFTWSLLFINEYKIQFIRFPNYFFLIWFFLAISINLSKRVYNENNNIR